MARWLPKLITVLLITDYFLVASPIGLARPYRLAMQ
jgi:hypothetical protein